MIKVFEVDQLMQVLSTDVLYGNHTVILKKMPHDHICRCT